MSDDEKILNATLGTPMPLQPEVHENEDCYDEDSGEYLGNLDAALTTTTIEIAIFRGGWWYVYKLDRKYQEEK